MKKVFVICSWCQEQNEQVTGRKTWCFSCGHRADIPRTLCDCRKCRHVELRKKARAA